MRVRWSPKAVDQLKAAYDYIAADEPSAAVDIVLGIWNAAATLARFPHSGRAGRIEGTRELVIPGTPFIVAYDIKGESVRILAILHTARRWPDTLKF